MRRKCYPLILIEILFLFSGCMYKFVNPSQKTIYVDYFANHTLQPQIETWILKNLKKTIVEGPAFLLVGDKEKADIVITGVIDDFTRNAEFISDSDQIMMACYKVKISFDINRNGKISQKNLEQVYSLELATVFKKDMLLDMLSKKIAQDIYYQIISNEE